MNDKETAGFILAVITIIALWITTRINSGELYSSFPIKRHFRYFSRINHFGHHLLIFYFPSRPNPRSQP